MPKFLDVTDTETAREYLGVERARMVNALDFGATGDGTTDDTAALQEWLDYLVTNHRQGWLPNGTYKITDTLVAAPGNGWAIHGENYNYTAISQATNNTPILMIGGPSHSFQLKNIAFTFASTQSSSNTNANAIVLDGDPEASTTDTTYFARFEYLFFSKGYYGIKVSEGMYAPWGNEFDSIGMRYMSGGLIDMSDVLAGGPNNRWGRCTLECNDAVGPIFKNLRCYNSTIDVIEILLANNSPQIITSIMPTFGLDVGSIKVEIASYTGAGTYLLSFPLYSNVRIGSVKISGTTAVFTPTSGVTAIVAMAGGADSGGSLEIGSILADATSLSGTCVAVIGGSDKSRIRVGHVVFSGGWTFQSTGSTTAGDYATVDSWVNHALSGDKGDANYTVTVGDPNVVHFDTAFTAQRTITLPASSSNDLCAGLYYDLVFDGAISGANTALIKHGSTTLRTQSVDKKRLRYVWRRAGSGSGSWVLVDVADIDTPTAFLGSADSNILAQSIRSNRVLYGGGTITVDGSSYVLWSANYQVASNGRSAAFCPDGFWNITCPTSGTVTGVGGASNKTATAAGIPLAAGESLFYILPLTSGESSVAANFRVVSYSADVEVPHHWVFICGRSSAGVFNFNNGINLRAGESFATSGLVSQRISAPASAGAAGTVGQWAADASWYYACVASNTWVRAALASW